MPSTYELEVYRDRLHDQAYRVRRHEFPPPVGVGTIRVPGKVGDPVDSGALCILEVGDIIYVLLRESEGEQSGRSDR